jgi:hypothetical protein
LPFFVKQKIIRRAYATYLAQTRWLCSTSLPGDQCVRAVSRRSLASRLSRADPSRTWVALPITTMFFKASICGIVGSGRSTLFWTDPWVDGHCISDLAPDLFLVAPRARKRSVLTAISNATWVHDIVGSLMISVLGQYLLLRQRLEDVTLNPGVEDQVQ